MHLAFDPETPHLGIPKESIRDVWKDTRPGLFSRVVVYSKKTHKNMQQ